MIVGYRWDLLEDKEKSKRLNLEMLLEEEQMDYSANRFWKSLDVETEANFVMQDFVRGFISHTVESYQYWIDTLSASYKTTSRQSNWPLLLFYLGAEKSAALTIITIIRCLYSDTHKDDDLFGTIKLSKLSTIIGNSAQSIVGFDIARSEFKDDFLRQSNYQKNWTPKRCVAFARKMHTIPDLPLNDLRHFGVNCIKMAEAAGVVSIENLYYKQGKKGKTAGVVRLSPRIQAEVSTLLRAGELNSIVYRPMLVPPVPHSLLESGGLLADYLRKGTVTRTHGFGQHHKYLVNNDTCDYNLGSVSSLVTLDALNTLQETEWAIQSDVMDVMATLFRNNTKDGLLPAFSFEAFDFGVPFPEEGSSQDVAKWKEAKEEAYSQWFKEEQKRTMLHTRLNLAKKIHSYGNYYYHPMSQDFRGRIYCDTIFLNPQSSDFDRGLIKFSKEYKQTDEGLYWLKVHIANLFDQDKLPFNERVDWCDVHLKDLLKVASDPYETRSFWVDNNTPKKNTTWQRLNAIMDLRQSLEHGLTSVPVQLDGSNNGAQHWAAIMKDPEVARLTNLVAVDKPQDLYQKIADIATEKIKDSHHPIHLAIKERWPNGIDRKPTKRPGMCYGYGITPYGCRKYMKEEGHVNTDWVPKDKMSAYQAELGNLIYESLYDLMEMPNQGKEFLYECARRVMQQADVKKLINGDFKSVINPFVAWESPSGFRAINSYWDTSPSVVYSMLYTRREVHYQDYVDDKGKSSSIVTAFPPNFIHSLDASHLVMTVNRLYNEFNLKDFSVVHDSFGVPAPYVPQLRRVIRETFYDIHKENQLKILKNYVEEYFKVDLPDVPATGTYDINDVLKAEYMFG